MGHVSPVRVEGGEVVVRVVGSLEVGRTGAFRLEGRVEEVAVVEEGGGEDVDVVVIMIAEGSVVVGVEDVDDVDDEEEDGEVVGVVDGGEEEGVVDEDGEGACTTTTVVDVDGLGVELEDGLAVTDGLTTIVVVELTTPRDLCC